MGIWSKVKGWFIGGPDEAPGPDDAPAHIFYDALQAVQMEGVTPEYVENVITHGAFSAQQQAALRKAAKGG